MSLREKGMPERLSWLAAVFMGVAMAFILGLCAGPELRGEDRAASSAQALP
jgi:hypothetical protein